MGFYSDELSECGDHRHEGYCVAYVPANWQPSPQPQDIGGWPRVHVDGLTVGQYQRLRELGSMEADHGCAVLGLAIVSAACACGWRSQHLHHTPHAEWSPSSVDGDQRLEDRVLRLWSEHVQQELARHKRGEVA